MARNPIHVQGRLTEAEKATIVERAQAGWSAGRIALRLNRHPGTVNFAMHALGLRVVVQRDRDYVRADGVRCRSFSGEEDAFIQALRIQGFTTPRIAALCEKRFGHPRSAATIGIRLKMIANREEAAAHG